MWPTIFQALIIGGLTALFTAVCTAYVSGKVLERVIEVKFAAIETRLATAEGEILLIRKRLHEWASSIGWVDQERRSVPRG